MDSTEAAYQCVNPHDIMPIRAAGQCATNANPDVLRQPIAEINNPNHYPVPVKREVKLDIMEMEEFGDLAPYIHSNGLINPNSSTADELNTPIFDRKGPFNFTINMNQSTIPPSTTTTAAEDLFKFDNDIFGNSVFAASTNLIKHLENNDISKFSPNLRLQQQQETSDVIYKLLPTNEEIPVHLYNGSYQTILPNQYNNNIDENNSVLSVNNSSSIPSSPCSSDLTYSNNKDTYEMDEEGATISCKNNGVSERGFPKKIKLPVVLPKLNLDAIALTQTMNALNTPDIIDSVVSLESDNFDLLDYVNEKDIITTVNMEDIHFQLPLLSPPVSAIKTEITTTDTATTTTNNINNTTKSRKRKRIQKSRNHRHYDDDEDDDDDYLPPSESKSSSRVSNDSDNDYSDSDGEEELVVVVRKVKRGRPARRTSSISSDDTFKYRELRDKNNEASRKSRLKRKMKEMTLEKEGDQLEEKNLKLKAQVDELNRMVESFRSNLFKIMLHK